MSEDDRLIVPLTRILLTLGKLVPVELYKKAVLIVSLLALTGYVYSFLQLRQVIRAVGVDLIVTGVNHQDEVSVIVNYQNLGPHGLMLRLDASVFFDEIYVGDFEWRKSFSAGAIGSDTQSFKASGDVDRLQLLFLRSTAIFDGSFSGMHYIFGFIPVTVTGTL